MRGSQANNPVAEMGTQPTLWAQICEEHRQSCEQAQLCGETDSEDRSDEYTGPERYAYMWAREFRKEAAE